MENPGGWGRDERSFPHRELFFFFWFFSHVATLTTLTVFSRHPHPPELHHNRRATQFHRLGCVSRLQGSDLEANDWRIGAAREMSPWHQEYEREQVYEESKEASAAARAAARASEERRPKPLDKGGGMWPAERVLDYGATLAHRIRKAVAASSRVGGGGGGAVAKG